MEKTFIGKDHFSKDLFIVGPKEVVLKGDLSAKDFTNYQILSVDGDFVGILHVKTFPIETRTIISLDENYTQVSVGSSDMFVYKNGLNVSKLAQNHWYEELVKSYLYSNVEFPNVILGR